MWYVSCSFTVTVYYFTIYFESDVVVSLVSSGIAQDERASFTVHVHLPVVGFHREKVRLYYQQNREKVLLRKALVRHLAGLPVKVGNLEKLRRENLIQ